MAFPVAIFGVLINLAGGLSTALGWAVQKYAHNEAVRTNTKYYYSKIWWLGMFLIILALPLYVISTILANQSTLCVVGPFTLIASLLLSKFMLNEVISCWEYCGIALFVPGVVLTLLFASMENNRLNQEQFNKIFYSKGPMTYFLINIGLVLIMSILSFMVVMNFQSSNQSDDTFEIPSNKYNSKYEKLEENVRNSTHKREGSKERLIEQENSTVIKRHSKDINNEKEKQDNEDYISKVCNSSHSESCFKSKAWKWICLIFFPYISTFFSSIAVMLVRTIDGLILAKPAVGHGSNFYGPLPIIYIVLVLVCISLSYLAINAGLKYYDSVYIAPLFKIGSLLHNLFSGGILLNEFHDYSNDKVKFGIFIAGISVCIVGISLLILGYKKSGKDQLN